MLVTVLGVPNLGGASGPSTLGDGGPLALRLALLVPGVYNGVSDVDPDIQSS